MKIRWAWALGGALAVLCLSLVGCAAVRLPNVPLDPARGPAAPSPLLGAFGTDAPIRTVQDWETRRAPLLRQAFADDVYGPYPAGADAPAVTERSTLDVDVGAPARVEQWRVEVGRGDDRAPFHLVLVLPAETSGPTPVIVMQNFCGNRAAFPGHPEAIALPLTPVFDGCAPGWEMNAAEIIFGRHIMRPPYAEILARGYGVAMFYAGDVVGDEPQSARQGLARLYGAEAERAGAIAAWAWLYTQARIVLAQDGRVDGARIAIWGHSRNAKAALLAAANDSAIAAVIAHQSGRGGASLNRSDAGERIAQMRRAYAWWFPPAYENAAGDTALDQHALLALIAPRPVLLGNSRRDAWADPLGAWRAAEAASPAYQLYGATGLAQDQLRRPNLHAGIGFYMRAGLHGVHSQDWRVFLDFLDAHLQGGRPSGGAPAQ